MSLLQVINYAGQRVLTTNQLAESFGTDNKHLSDNYSNNKSRYREGKHFFLLKGQELKEFKEGYPIISDTLKFASVLQLWTEKGAWMHAKSLNTDQAWEAYELLVDDYYHMKQPELQTVESFLTNPDTIIKIAENWKAEKILRIAAEQKIEEDKPKVIFAEALETSKDSILVNDMAKLLKQNGIKIGQKRLFEWLRQNGYLIKGGSDRNMPTQRSMELEIMEIKVGQRLSTSEGSKITRTPKITGKGQVYFINKFKAV
jgi:phage antirepressor YoqD-like protein